jgi:MFS family permease
VAGSTLAEVLAKPLLSWIGDRFDRRWVLLACNGVSTAVALALVVMRLGNYFSVTLLSILLVVYGASTGLRDPVQSSILPSLVPVPRVSDAMRIRSMFQSLSLLFGATLAGTLISVTGISTTLVGTAVALLSSTLIVAILETPLERSRADLATASWWRRMTSGFAVVLRIRTELGLALVAMVLNFALAPFFTALLPAYVKQVIGYPAWFVGVLDAAFGVGLLVGSAFVLPRVNARFGRDRAVFLGFLLLGLCLTGTAAAFTPVLVVPLMLLGGVGLLLVNLNAALVRTIATPESYRTRVAGTVGFLSMAATPIGGFACSGMIALIGEHVTIAVLGVFVLVGAFAVLAIPQFSYVMRLEDEKMSGVYAILYPDAFSPRKMTSLRRGRAA